MKITISLNGVKVERQIPISYQEITFSTFLKLDGSDPTKSLSIFTDIPEEILRRAKIENLSSIIQILSFLKDEIKYSLPIEIMGHKIPKDLEMETIAQYEDIKNIFAKFKDNETIENIKQYPLIAATYCVDYSQDDAWKKAEELAPQLFELPCVEVLAIGNFTLVKLTALRLNTRSHFLQEVTRLRKFKPVMIVLIKRLAFTIRYYFLKRKLHLKEQSY
jgi:hypothetical protein